MEDSFELTPEDSATLDYGINVIEEDERLQAEATKKEAELAEQKKQEEEQEQKSGPEKLVDLGKDVVGAVKNIETQRNVGIARGLNGIFTMPQRMYDMGTGEIERQEAEGGTYSPGWDPFRDYIEDNKPKNWWEAGTQIGFEVGTQIGATAATGGVTGLGSTTAGRVGLAAFDATLDVNIGTNKQQLLVSDNVPWLKDQFNDSPQSKTLKAILENLAYEGIGEVIGALWGRANRAVDAEDIEIQRVEKAQQEVADEAAEQARYRTGYQLEGQRGLPEGIDKVEVKDITDEVANEASTFRAAKNSQYADPGQGANNSRSSRGQQFEARRKQMQTDEDIGTAGYTFTPKQTERMANQNGMTMEEMDKIAQELYSSEQYQRIVGNTLKSKTSWYEANREVYYRFQQTMGKFEASKNPEEFFAEMLDRQNLVDDQKVLRSMDVNVIDLINAEMFQAIRNRGMAALELGEKFDIMDTDGPMAKAAEYLTIGLAHVRRARYLKSDDFRQLAISQKKQDVAKGLSLKEAEFAEEARESVEGFMRFVKDQPNDDAAKAAAELFAKSDINDYGDIGAYLNSKFRRGDFGKYGQGTPALARDFNVLTMLSQLSSPKTLFKAFKGTVEIGLDRMVGQVMGGVLTGNMKTAREGVAAMSFVKHMKSDFMRVFNKNLEAWWNKDIAKLGNRYSAKSTANDELFNLWHKYQMDNAGLMGQFHAQTMKAMRDAARWQGFSYPFAALSTIDEMAGTVMAKSRASQLAMRDALQNKKWYEPIDKEAYDEAQEIYLRSTMDADGNIDFDQDQFLKAGFQEITLTKPLEGPFAAFDSLVEKVPELGIAYRYMTTGVNSIAYNYKKIPVIGMAHREFIDIGRSMIDGDLGRVAKYGIENLDDLKAAAAIWAGRNAIGMMTVAHIIDKKLNNELTGNGPMDYAVLESWKRAGWKERQISYGPISVSLEGFDTFNILAYGISDIIDNSKLMGKRWTDKNLATYGFAVAASLTSKSMLSGVNNMIKAISMPESGAGEKVVTDMLNSAAPWAGLRNALGKVLKPGVMELNSAMGDSIRNRNRFAEPLAGDDQLRQKVDLLYGTNLTPWDYLGNALNTFSPIELDWRANDRPGRDLLIASGYPKRLISYSYGNIDLSEERTVRAKFGEAISRQGLGKALDKLASDPQIRASMDRMEYDRENGVRVENPMATYHHLKVIHNRIEKAKKKAWAEISGDGDVQAVINKKKETLQQEASTLRDTRSQTEALINWNNK